MVPTNSQAVRVVLYGRVQGVGFRDFALNEALKLNLNGYVKNQTDGSVVVFAEGPLHALSKYQGILKKGPALASVKSLEADYLPPAGYTDFKIIQQ